MIEVERRLFLSATQRAALLAALPSGCRRRFWDTYFDGPDQQLTTRDWWLRRRDSAWELKVQAAPPGRHGKLPDHQTYEEVVCSSLILDRLVQAKLLPRTPAAVPAASSEAQAGSGASDARLTAALEAQGIRPFARMMTDRLSVKNAWASAGAVSGAAGQVTLDLDTVTFDLAYAEAGSSAALAVAASAESPPPFLLAEVEVMVPKGAGAEAEAAALVDRFLAAHGLQHAQKAYSKLLEYLVLYRPLHFEALSRVGVVPREQFQTLLAGAAARGA